MTCPNYGYDSYQCVRSLYLNRPDLYINCKAEQSGPIRQQAATVVAKVWTFREIERALIYFYEFYDEEQKFLRRYPRGHRSRIIFFRNAIEIAENAMISKSISSDTV